MLLPYSRTLTFQKNSVICLIESPLKMMKYAFYFILKALFVLRYLNFYLHFLVFKKNGLIRKIRLISKFITSQPAKERITMHILSNISRSKGNQTLKFGQVKEYNKRNIFLRKSCRK